MGNKILSYSIFVLVCIITACSDDKLYEDKNLEKIRFSAVSNNDAFTRGTPIMTSNDIENICVYGYYTGDGSNNTWDNTGSTTSPTLFDGVIVTNSGVGTGTSSWSYATTIYWPFSNEANVSFFAYSPVENSLNGVTILSTTGVPSLHYSTPTKTVDQPDLMVAVPRLDLNRTSASPVTFTMKHALTCIGFQGLAHNKVIKSISVSGISLEGDLSMDGSTINWSNLSSPDTTTILVGLDKDTLTTTMSTELTAADGYLLLIPQTLKSDAKITVNIQDEDEVVFNLTDSVWTAGQFITYRLIDDYIEVSPNDITVSALGIDTDTLSVTCFPSNASWTLNSPVSWLKLSLNKDGSDASESISGTGDNKIYIIIDSYMVNASKTRTTSIYEGNQTSNIKVDITQNGMKMIPTSSQKSYAGAFWRCKQIGERLIRIPSDIGDWKAFVFWMDDQWTKGDIVLDGGSYTWPLDTSVPADSDTPALTATTTSITGNTSSGVLSFRIGLKNTYTATSSNPARYALVAITWNNDLDAQFLFIRQGEDPDYLMRPSDNYGNEQSWASSPNWRPLANKISAFNLTADTLDIACNGARDGANPSRFTDYPSKAGAFFQWANEVNTRYAYNPIKDPENWNYTWPTSYWNTLSATNETSPINYTLTYGDKVDFRRPRSGSITGPTTSTVQDSEIVQSLYYSPYSSIDNMIYAYLADGYFDRLAFTGDYTVNGFSVEVAYWGQLVYNPINKASIFIPYSGFIAGEGGIIESREQYINVWTSSSGSSSTAIIWNFGNENNGDILPNARGAGFTIRSVIDNK